MFLGDKKKIWFSYVPRDYRAMITILEEKALQGWRLKKMHQYVADMEKTQPKEITYFADFFTEKSVPDYPSHPEFREYLARRKEAGYALAGQRGQLLLFHNDTDIRPTEPPLSKEELEKKLLQSKATSPMFIILFSFPIIAWMLWYQLFIGTVFFFPFYFGHIDVFYTNFMLVFNALLPPMVLLPLFTGEVRKFYFLRRLEKAISEGAEFRHQTVAQAKRKIWAKDIPIIIFSVIFFATAFTSDFLGRSFFVLAALLFVGMRYLERSKLKHVHKSIITGVFIFSFHVSANLIVPGQDMQILNADSIPKDYPLITLTDFALTDESSEPYFRYRNTGSILVPLVLDYREYNQETYLFLDIYQTISPEFSNYLYDRIIAGFHPDKNYLYIDEDYPFERTTTTFLTENHTFDKVLSFNNVNRYVIKKNEFIVNIGTNGELGRDKILAEVQRLIWQYDLMSNLESNVDIRIFNWDEHELIEKTDANPYDIFGNTPDKVVNDFFTALMEKDYEKAYRLHPQDELYLKPTFEEFIQMWELVINYDFMVLDYTITAEDRAGVRLYYVIDPGYGEQMIIIKRTYWACMKEDGVWKVEWLPEQG